jgi:hypothetical protein
MEFREQLIQKAMNDCKHFNGVQHDCCKVGVNYEALIENGKYRIPCLKFAIDINRDPAICEKFAAMTREEAEANADSLINARGESNDGNPSSPRRCQEERFSQGTRRPRFSSLSNWMRRPTLLPSSQHQRPYARKM